MLSLRTFDISRLTVPEGADEGSYRRAFVATGAGISGFLENATPEFAAIVDGEFGKTFSLFSDDLSSDVKIGDRITDAETSTEYDVKGVLRNTDGPGRKLQLTLTLAIDQ